MGADIRRKHPKTKSRMAGHWPKLKDGSASNKAMSLARAMADAGVDFDDLGGIAAAAGPGLIGGVMVGLVTGKAIAQFTKTCRT